MRRWNGWGDDTIDYPLHGSIERFLGNLLGPGTPPVDAQLGDVVASVPASRLPAHDLISIEALDRVHHARGQSLPDWIALRSGRVGIFPDGVAFPRSREDVRELLRYGKDAGVHIIPYGGGTSVVGHINPMAGETPVLTVDLHLLDDLHLFDACSGLATFGAGISGPDLEARLRALGYTLGHFPQSFELSTLGGWIATRSSGQQSLYYGRIESLFAGATVETPVGALDLPPFPASAAGPDLRQIILGSEGRFGIITDATVIASPLPEVEEFVGVFFPDFENGTAAIRQMVQSGLTLSMLRLSTAVETATTLALAGHERLISTLESVLKLRGIREDKTLLILGVTGTRSAVNTMRRAARRIASEHKGVSVGQQLGRQWQKSRFRTPYLRNALWERGYAVDTVETATWWSNVSTMIARVEQALRSGLSDIGERVHAFTHLSHVYSSGASVYTTYLYRIAPDPDETLRRWQILKAAASHAIMGCGGTISHQHGVGLDHMNYMAEEKGSLSMAIIDDVRARLDPQRLMNPGKLMADDVGKKLAK
jgi:alkyldihydroxyacetonephosphate synthase